MVVRDCNCRRDDDGSGDWWPMAGGRGMVLVWLVRGGGWLNGVKIVKCVYKGRMLDLQITIKIYLQNDMII